MKTSGFFVLAIPLLAQTDRPKTIEFPGTALKWVRIAEPEFKKNRVDLDQCTIFLGEEPDAVTVFVENPDDPPDLLGGRPPCNFQVEISKKTMKVIQSSYTR